MSDQFNSEPLRQLAEQFAGTSAAAARLSNLYEAFLAGVEPPFLRRVLDAADWNQSRAAAWLGLNRATLRKKMKQYGLARPAMRIVEGRPPRV